MSGAPFERINPTPDPPQAAGPLFAESLTECP
jgi:hypothetical protein